MKEILKDSLDENYELWDCGSFYLRTALCGNKIGQIIEPVFVGINGNVYWHRTDSQNILLNFEI